MANNRPTSTSTDIDRIEAGFLELSKTDPARFAEISHDLDRAEMGENRQDLDMAVRDLQMDTIRELRHRLANASRVPQTSIEA